MHSSCLSLVSIMGLKEVTIYDIARRLNIAPSTVSRGLKGHHTVSIETQKKIAETAAEMGYQSNTFAVGLRTKRTNTIGVVIPRLNSNLVAEILAGIEKVTNDRGYNLIIAQSLESREKEIRNVRTMFANRVDGLLISLSGNTSDIGHLEMFFQKNIPVLFFDRIPAAEVPAVCINNEEAAYQITRHLLEQGAKLIVHVSGNQEINVYADRFKGYQRALGEAGIAFDETMLFVSKLDEGVGELIAGDLMQLGADAIFAANDVSAASCMNALRCRGIRVPEDLLIAGFNDDILARNVTPALTTIRYPAFEMGELVARNMLEQLLQKAELNRKQPLVLQSSLVIRGSTRRSED